MHIQIYYLNAVFIFLLGHRLGTTEVEHAIVSVFLFRWQSTMEIFQTNKLKF